MLHVVQGCAFPGVQISASPIHGHNQWPVQLPAFDNALRSYIQSMLSLGAMLMEGEGPCC